MNYVIHCEPNYYAGSINTPLSGILRDDNYHYIALASRADADTLCAMLNDYLPGYTLSPGQYAPPAYTVREFSLPARHTLVQAMRALRLQYDFAPSGSRLPFHAGV